MIETHDLTKKYGDHFAVKGLEINLKKGDVFGFIGPNGAGKTTTMRILATLLNPTWGEAYVGGYSIYTQPHEIRRHDRLHARLLRRLRRHEGDRVSGVLRRGLSHQGPARRKVCNEVLELVDLGYKRDAFVTSLSRGMTQRLGLARVLLHDPQVLLLDEPASGLDPRARIEIRGLLKQLRDMGKTIMVSSHILPELADICNKIGIIELGVLEVNEEVAEVMKRLRRTDVLNVGRGRRSRGGGPAVGRPPDGSAHRPSATDAAGDARRSGGRLQRTGDAVGPAPATS